MSGIRMMSMKCILLIAAEGEACFDPDSDPSKAPAINADTETFCNQCAWHGKFEALSHA